MSRPPHGEPDHPAAGPRPQDRRTSPRLHFAADITFSSGNNFFAGRTKDISTGGLFFETTAVLEVGQEVWIRLRVLGQPFAVTAKVCWLLYDKVGRPRGAGVAFTNTPPPMREAIELFMKNRSPIEFDFEPSFDHEPPPLPPKRAEKVASPSGEPHPAHPEGEREP